MVELRGIVIDSPEGHRRVRLLVRGERGGDYTTLEYPSGGKLTWGAIKKYLGRELGIGVSEIVLAPHVKIPEE